MINILEKQLNNFWLLSNIELEYINQKYIQIQEYTVECLKKCNSKYFQSQDFDNMVNKVGLTLNTNAYAIFLYKFSRQAYEEGMNELATKLYYLNKIMHSVELFYEVELPQVFILDHPLGSVMGRAKYGEFFAFSQGCTVGNNKGIYPQIGNFVTMMSNSKIIGASIIGDNCIISANTYIKDAIIPNNTIVFNQGRKLIFKENTIDNRVNWIF